MKIFDPMITSRYERACPYCHTALGERVDADTHIVGCCERWRQQHHVNPTPAPATTPSIGRWTMPEPSMPTIESSSDRARRIIADNGPLSAAFRSLPAYEPAA
jgi:hypothetical protein